jgi:chemotaxis-related protein WspD
VYWDAGRRVFEKDVPEGYLEQWTQALANEPDTRAQVSRSVIYFRLGEEWFSLATKIFVEVAQARSIHRIPHRADSLMQGVVNVGGAVRLCFSLTSLLGVNNSDQRDASPRYGVYQRYLAVQINNADYVFPVDEVGGVYRYDPQDLKQVPVTIEPRKAELLLGMLDIKGNNIACIDADKLGQAFEKVLGE